MKLKINPKYYGSIWSDPQRKIEFKPEEVDESNYLYLFKNHFAFLFDEDPQTEENIVEPEDERTQE